MNYHRPITTIAIVGAATAVLAACSSSGSSGPSNAAAKSATQSSTGPSSTAPAKAGYSAPAAAATSANPAAHQVSAKLTEFKIALQQSSLTAGTYTFAVKNAGNVTHALTVQGPGVSGKSTGDMSPGSSKTLTVTLHAGKYDVFCPVGNHKMLGMDDTVTVH
jgi:uncharacterized cupredoxin-like copper-binding protein